MPRITDNLWGWTAHGIERNGKWNSTKTEYTTVCPWCLSEKFFINPSKGAGVYQCKVCSQQGNYLTFLKEISKLNKEAIRDVHFDAMATDRGLPIEAFEGYGFGWNGQYFTLPIRSIDKELVGLKLWKPENKLLNSPHTQASLFCSHRLKNYPGKTVYLAEGEWDVIAFTWLLKTLKKPGIVVGVPGAQSKIDPWELYLYDKDVIVLYDHDQAGVEGEFKVYSFLQTKVHSMRFLHWPEKKKTGYDLRDHVVKHAVKAGDPEKCFKLLSSWLHEVPRKLSTLSETDPEGKKVFERREKYKPITFNELIEKYQDYLYLPNTDSIRIVLATIFANRVRSEMLWLFLVAPPSNAKSEIITSLFACPEIEAVSKVTEHTLVSGWIGTGGKDVSLIEKLRNRILAVKDFTPILGMNPVKQEEIFGVFRDAYDGKIDVMFGHGQHRRYSGIHFGIVAGVTSAIESFGRMQQTLGERFLRYYIPVDYSIAGQMLKMDRAMENIGHETKKKKDLQEAVVRFIQTHEGGTPAMPKEIRKKIEYIALFTAAMRGIVPRDWKDRVQYHAATEGPMRLAKQLGLLAYGLACLEKKPEITDEELRLVREVALSTCPDLVRSTVKVLHEAGDLALQRKELEIKTHLPLQTIRFVIDDLKLLNIIKQMGTGFTAAYTLTDTAKELVKLGEVYPPVPVKKRSYVLSAT